jgi:DNA (cytosine-5)-methyltransferase 1
MTFTAASCFSGIGGAELALPEAQWLWSAEIEPFPCALLERRFDHPNLGDITADDFIDRARAFGRLDLLCGGPPCQAFSIAGLRKGMLDPRGLLSLRFIQVAHELASTTGLGNLLVENVPGWLSHPENAFGCFLGGLVGADDALPNPEGGSWPRAGMVAGPRARAAWRVLDAQYAGLAQRRQRVFLVADFGDGADPAAVLFERQGLHGNPAPRRETGEGVAGTLSARTDGGGGLGTDFECCGGLQPVGFGGGNTSGPVEVAACLTAKGRRIDFEVETFVADTAHTLRAEGFDASEDGTGRGTPLGNYILDSR